MAAPSPPASALWHAVAGALGGSLAAAALCPLVVVRTRLQSADAVKMRPDRLLVHIVRTEGVPGLFRGLTATVLGVGPSRALYFGFFSQAKQALGGATGSGSASEEAFPGEELAPPSSRALLSGTKLHLAAATLAGIATNSLMSPWWVVRLRLQLQVTPVPLFRGARAGGAGAAPPAALRPGAGYTGMVDAFLRIYREEGPRTFYRGLAASYLGVIETALQFGLYGAAKDALLVRRRDGAVAALLAERGLPPGAPLPPDVTEREIRRACFSDSTAFGLSAGVKLVAAAATYPHEVLRTRLREQRADTSRYRGILHAFVTIAREEGRAGLYGGMSVHLVRTCTSAAVLVMVVERLVGGDL